MSQQTKAEISAFYKKFTWLGNFIKPSDVQSIRVSRIDEKFLHTKIAPHSTTGDVMCPIHQENYVYLLTEDGMNMEQVSVPSNINLNTRWKKIWWMLTKCFVDAYAPESPSDTLVRLGKDSGNVTMALQILTDGDVIIHKSPRGFTLDNWSEKLRERAELRVEQQLAAVDTGVKIPPLPVS